MKNIWISPKKKLPKIGEKVLVLFYNREIYIDSLQKTLDANFCKKCNHLINQKETLQWAEDGRLAKEVEFWTRIPKLPGDLRCAECNHKHKDHRSYEECNIKECECAYFLY